MKKFLKIMLYFIILSSIAIISAHYTFTLLSYGRTIIMPDLRGMDLNGAQRLLDSYKLLVRIDGEEYDHIVSQGLILKQDIPPGSKIKEGREVGIILSKGPRIKNVPNLLGKSLEEGEALLKERGLKLNKIIFVHSETVEKNVIIAQRPEPVESGGNQFNIIVSLGDYKD
ncbi:MAG: PASTA domain-containing protein [Thermodesulfovibrionales bacterium]|nr:PASTA domain-containing protein [Thermodesulfovibrionales bacterium]